MKVLVCGSRRIDNRRVVGKALNDCPFDIEMVIHGGADGVDSHAEQSARARGIPTEPHPIPEWVWSKIGAKAGPMRNGYMVDEADAVIAVWDGESSGTENAMKQAESEGLPIYKVVCAEQDGHWKIETEKLIEDDQACLGDFTASDDSA